MNTIKSKIYNKLKIAKNVEENSTYLEVRNAFIDKFTLCDLTCIEIISRYSNNQKQKGKVVKVELHMKTIKQAFESFDIEYDEDVLNLVFGGSGLYVKRGSKSAKKIRNKIVHEMNENDLKELMNRKDELFNAMDMYLSLFVDK